jgi:hypothetical protein
MAAGQGIFKYRPNDSKTGLALGGGIYSYVNAKGFSPFFDADEPMGNSLDNNGDYANGYELVEVFIEGTHEFSYFPLTVMVDFVTNTSADSLNAGWLAGLRAGKAKKPGSWDFRYIYRELEKDATVGMFTDSDFRGGGTDARGHEIGGGYQVASNSKINLTYFINKIGLNNGETDFNRLQLDLQLKF